MVRLSVAYGDQHELEKEHILVAYHQTVLYIRTVDYYHTTKPTKQKVPFLCDVGMLKNTYGKLPRLDQLAEISHMTNIPEKKLLIFADQSGNVVVSDGPPKMNVVRRVCTGSEVTAMEYLQSAEFKPSNKDHSVGVPMLVYAYRSISGVYGDGHSRIRFWNFKSNETLAEIDLPSELNNIVYCAETNQVICSSRQGHIWKIVASENLKGRGPAKPTMEFEVLKKDPTAEMTMGGEGDHLLRVYSMDKTAGLLGVSQQGKLFMWHLHPTFQSHLELDCLYHVGNCSKSLFLHYKRTNPGSLCADDVKRLEIEDGDMLIVGGDEQICFVNPYDLERPCIRRLDFREGVRALTQWRNLVMVGTKCGLIIGIDPFSGVHQLKLQLGVNAPIEQLVGGVDVLRAVNSRGRLAVWALKGIDVVRLVELEAENCGVHNVGSSQLPSGHNHLGAGNYEVLRRIEKGQGSY